ncbi:MAG: hypothetical protein COY86_08900 [Rhodobacterales bacterium CG_4_10_14_0_8_um_filter_70_9]|nr:MAG: hypothetical protein COY86_08900 [Rhodobacterales bacterium CG_4_10_14_0_8_um_filter_70_9]
MAHLCQAGALRQAEARERHLKRRPESARLGEALLQRGAPLYVEQHPSWYKLESIRLQLFVD